MDDFLNESLDFCRSYRSHLAELLALRDNGPAIRYFESVQHLIIGRNDLESGIFLHLGARAYGLSNNNQKALLLIRAAIAIISKNGHEASELGDCFMTLGDLLKEMGKYTESEKAYRDAESIFRRNDNLAQSGDALNRLAGMLFRKGDLEGALRFLLESIEAARKGGEQRKLSYLFGNIGRVYTLLGKLESAEENIRFNIEISAQIHDEIELARAYLSLGYIQIQKYNLTEAEISLAKSLEYIRSNRMQKEEAIYWTYAGELAIKMEQYDHAKNTLEQALLLARSIAPESLLTGRPLRLMADLETRRGNYRRAISLCNQALVIMSKLKNELEKGALYRILAQCFEKSGLTDKARSSFKLSAEILEEHKAKFELADCLAEMGRSGIFDTRQQFRYLCRAEELYHDCNIQLKVLEMQKLISRLELKTGKAKIAEKLGEVEKNSFPTKNARMAKIISQLRLLRNCELPILLIGETGTGKDHLARYFHSISRPSGPFVAVNCAAVPDNLLESELFGYQKGAFTGADSDKRGLFSAANAGVILLDEIGELPLPLQAKLLSVIETKRLRPLGTAHEIELNLTIVAATNRNLYEMVKEGIFRTDLYYRLAGVTIELPPLRERKEDIPCLLELFMRQNDLLDDDEKVDSELISQFVHYEWPGNIRQMENKVKHLSILRAMAKEGSIAELSRGFFEEAANESTSSLFEQVEQFEKRLIRDALAASNGNKSKAAKVLQIHESTFREKMKRYGILEALAS